LPQFVLKTESGVHTRFGLFMPVSGKVLMTDSDSDVADDGSNVQMDMEIESKPSMSFGFTAALGYGMELSDQMTFFAELQYNAISVKSGSSIITKYEVAGQDQLVNMTTSQIETTYVDSVDGAATQDPNSASESLRSTSPFSSLGVNVGITFNF
jgi:hypothetical protein